MAGLLYKHNFLYIKDVVTVPQWLGTSTYWALGWLVRSPPPTDTAVPMGATLELQRQQQMELLEQQLLWAQLQQRPQVSNSETNIYFCFIKVASGGRGLYATSCKETNI